MENQENDGDIFAATVPFIIRKITYDRVKGFDEDFFLYFEEVDLCWRVWLAGKRVTFVPQAKAMHVGGVSTGKLSSSSVVEFTLRNRLQSYLINLGALRLPIALLMQLLMGALAVVILLLRTKITLSFAVARAFAWNLWHLPRSLSKRTQVQKSRLVEDRDFLLRVTGPIPLNKLLFLVGFRTSL